MHTPLPLAASLVHLPAADVLGPKTCAHHFAQSLFLPKTVLMLPRPKRPPTDAVTMVLRAWRREVELARTLVSSSKLVGRMFSPRSGARLRRKRSRRQVFF